MSVISDNLPPFRRSLLVSLIGILPALLLTAYVLQAAMEAEQARTAPTPHSQSNQLKSDSATFLYKACANVSTDHTPSDGATKPTTKISSSLVLSQSTFCLGYLSGHITGFLAARATLPQIREPWCIPANTKWVDISKTYLDWYKKHPEFETALAATAVADMLMTEYPCAN